MSEKNYESKIVILPGVGQFLVKQVEETDRAESNGSRQIGFLSNLEKTPSKQGIYNPELEATIKQYLGINEPTETGIGFERDIKAQKRTTLDITPITRIYLPNVTYKERGRNSR